MKQNNEFELAQVIKLIETSQYLYAENNLRKILINNPYDFLLNYLLGVCCSNQAKHSKAADHFKVALKSKPENEEILLNIAIALQAANQDQEARLYYKRVISKNENNAQAWIGLGKSFSARNESLEALNCYDKAIALNPQFVEAWSNRGASLKEMKRYEEALTSFNQAIALNPQFAEAWSNRGTALSELKRYEEALTSFNQAFSIKPSTPYILGDLLQLKLQTCNWDQLSILIDILREQISIDSNVCRPFTSLVIFDDPIVQLLVAKAWSSRYYENIQKNSNKPNRFKNHSIKIGYFSADFYNHAVSTLIAGIFENHNKTLFEIYGFSYGFSKEDSMQKRIKESLDHFIDVSTLSDYEIAQLARKHKIDIAIDLTGYTGSGRVGIFAHRAAPIQINFLGYPGSLGTSFVDYLLADRNLITDKDGGFYSEKILHLPHCYQPNDSRRQISDLNYSKIDHSLPEDTFIYCCFNGSYKITPIIFECWMDILKDNPHSILWLLDDNDLATANLRNEAMKRNIDPKRLIFAKKTSPEDHRARYKFVDIFLDTFPYGAHTTASDALWSGAPIISLKGKTFASRVCSSLLQTMNTPELIATTLEEYKGLAIKLAKNKNLLDAIREKIKTNKHVSKLFNTQLFTEELEKTFQNLIETNTNNHD